VTFWKDSLILLLLGLALCAGLGYAMTRSSLVDGQLSGVVGLSLLCVMALVLIGADYLLRYLKERRR
jgi:hypothetical protein